MSSEFESAIEACLSSDNAVRNSAEAFVLGLRPHVEQYMLELLKVGQLRNARPDGDSTQLLAPILQLKESK